MVLTVLDRSSNDISMFSETPLTWSLVNEVASELGAKEYARAKWRQAGRGVPAHWRIKITQELMSRGVPVSLADFDRLPETPGRIAA